MHPEHLQIAAYLGQHTVRPVARNEYIHSSEAMDAYWKEWTNLEAKGVYRWDTLVECSDVSREARSNDVEVHPAFLFGFMVEKGAEYDPGTLVKSSNIEWRSEETTLRTSLLRSRYSRRWLLRLLL